MYVKELISGGAAGAISKTAVAPLEYAVRESTAKIKIFNKSFQGINKGLVADRLLTTMKERGMLPDFVLCVGDDRSDEDMFEAITRAVAGPSLSPVAEVFACTVGRKSSKARYFLEDPSEILRMLQGLAAVSELHLIKNVIKGFEKVVIE